MFRDQFSYLSGGSFPDFEISLAAGRLPVPRLPRLFRVRACSEITHPHFLHSEFPLKPSPPIPSRKPKQPKQLKKAPTSPSPTHIISNTHVITSLHSQSPAPDIKTNVRKRGGPPSHPTRHPHHPTTIPPMPVQARPTARLGQRVQFDAGRV